MLPEDARRLIERAVPLCSMCSEPAHHTEITWRLSDDGRWRPSATIVCIVGHRTPVRQIDTEEET